ncbi:MAG: type II toxin-antitoxin system RelB/DinJ family antitoxin [Chloroflexi bacterium]|nr:type II toxin-antitoxin system RelB/DinJ family antitoxin [Chloroflexota bacterium]
MKALADEQAFIFCLIMKIGVCGGLPFQPTAKTPNAETLAAMMELEDGGGEVFFTTDDLFADWNR